MSLRVLVHFLLFNIYLTYLLVKMVLSAVLKFSNSIISLFFTSLTSRIFIALLFLTRIHILFNNKFLISKNLIKSYLNRHPSHLIFDTNLFDNNFNLFNSFLTNFNSSAEFAICSGIPSGEGPSHMESSPPISNINLLPQFYMVGDLSGGYSQTDRKFNFNTNVNVTADSYLKRSFNFSFSQYPLIAVLMFLKVKIRKDLRCNIVSLEYFLKLNNKCQLISKFSNLSQFYLTLINLLEFI